MLVWAAVPIVPVIVVAATVTKVAVPAVHMLDAFNVVSSQVRFAEPPNEELSLNCT